MVVVIAENAINYDNLTEAKALILREHELKGVITLSKFQLYSESEILSEEHKEYCLKRMLTYEMAKELVEYGNEIGQIVFFTIMNPKFIEWTEKLDVEMYKIRYYDRKNSDIYNAILKTDKPFFISTDNTYIPHIKQAIHLWCSPKYPSTLEDYEKANLYNFKGYSDHLGNVELLKKAIKEGNRYHELHVCMTREGCLEADWAITLQELEAALMEVSHA